MRALWLLVFTLLAACASPDEIVQLASFASPPRPAYPALSRRMMEQGRVELRVHVLANGDPGEVQLAKSSGFARLDASAMVAAKSFKFNPARTRSGRAVDSWMNAPSNYRLE